MIRYIIRSLTEMALCILGGLALTALSIAIAGDYAFFLIVLCIIIAVAVSALFTRQ